MRDYLTLSAAAQTQLELTPDASVLVWTRSAGLISGFKPLLKGRTCPEVKVCVLRPQLPHGNVWSSAAERGHEGLRNN